MRKMLNTGRKICSMKKISEKKYRRYQGNVHIKYMCIQKTREKRLMEQKNKARDGKKEKWL